MFNYGYKPDRWEYIKIVGELEDTESEFYVNNFPNDNL
jgi:hypothetical protein